MIRELHDCFSQLNNALTFLQNELLKHSPQHWFPLTAEEQRYGSSLQMLTGLIGDLWYHDHQQDGRETRARHGLVLINADTAKHIQDINHLKDQFKRSVQNCRKALGETEWLEQYGQLSANNLREAMTNNALARVHLRQCYRHLPLIEEWPRKVGFSWYISGRSIRKLSRAQVENMLLNLGAEKPHIHQQLQLLKTLPQETWFAQVQSLAPVVRANLVFENRTQAMNASLPLFIVDRGIGLPEFTMIDLTPPNTRQKKARADQKIEPEPFLPSLRIHRYKTTND